MTYVSPFGAKSTADTVTPTPSTSKGYVSPFAPTPDAPKGSPLTQPKTAGITTGKPQVEAYSPSTVLPKPSATPSPTPKASYGSSNLTDPYSAKPLLTYENPQAQQSQLLADRTALPFDPTVAQKIDPKVLQNGRMPQEVSQAIKSAIPNSIFDELDHEMPLELGGSNLKGNLQLEPGSNSSKPYSPGKNPTTTDPLENALAAQVRSGKISLVDAWKLMAKAKGYKLPEDGGPVPSGQGSGQIKPPSTYPSVGDVALDAFPALTQSLADLQTNPLSLGSSLKEIITTPFTDMTKASDAYNSALVTFIKSFQTNTSAATKISDGLDTATAFASGAISPVSSFFDAGSKIPIVGSVIKLLFNVPFALIGDMSGDTGVSALRILSDVKKPDGTNLLSPQTVAQLTPSIRAVSALVGQIVAGKSALDYAEVIRGLTPKFGPEDAKAIVEKAQEVARETSKTQMSLVDMTKKEPTLGNNDFKAIVDKALLKKEEKPATPLIQAPEKTETLPVPQEVKALPAPDSNAKVTTTGEGFTVTDKPDKAMVAKGKALSAYKDALAKYNAEPTESRLEKVIAAKQAKDELFNSKEANKPAVSETATPKASKGVGITKRVETPSEVRTTVTDLPKETPVKSEGKPEVVTIGESKGAEEITQPKEKVVPTKTRARTLKPIEGTGETKTRGLSKGVEAKAIQNKLTENGFGDLPEYKTVNMEDQSKRAADLVNKDPEGARAMAMGEKAVLKGTIPEAVYIAVENKAIAEGDVQTLKDLANSKLSTEATTMGQRIRTLAERDPESPVGRIKELQAARETAAQERAKGVSVAEQKRVTVKDITDNIKKASSRPRDWASFVQSITC